MKSKDIIIRIVSGIGIGMPVTIICMTLFGGWNAVIKEFLVWLVASALFGLLTNLFNIQKLSLPLITIIHCLSCMVITCGACAILGYTNNLMQFALYVLPIFIVVYAVIYTVTLINAKVEAKKINEALQSKE